MRFKDAKALHNRDQVEVRVGAGQWEPGYVLGEPAVEGKDVWVPVQAGTSGFMERVHHRDLR